MAVFLWNSHTGDTVPYPVGDERGASLLTTICWPTALVLLVRRAALLALAALFTVPPALQLRRRRGARLSLRATRDSCSISAPIFCLLVGLGGAAILSRSRRPPLVHARAGRWSRWPCWSSSRWERSVRDFFKPYKDKCLQRDRDFARWFWPEKSSDAELVCLQNDLHQCFYSGAAEGDDLASIFFCNQRIYWRRRWAAEKPGAERQSFQHPSAPLCPLQSRC